MNADSVLGLRRRPRNFTFARCVSFTSPQPPLKLCTYFSRTRMRSRTRGVRSQMPCMPTGSSSRMVRVTSSGSVTPAMDAEPDTVTTWVGSGSPSSTGAIVTVLVLAVAFASKLSTVLALSEKSSSVAGATGLADTVTVKAVAEAGDTVAVTVTGPASSATSPSASLRCSVTSSPGGMIGSASVLTASEGSDQSLAHSPL